MIWLSVVESIALTEASRPSAAAQSAAPVRANSSRRVRTRPRLDVVRRFLAWRQRRATRIILSALDDRTLRDIGMERGEIDAIVRSMGLPDGR